MCDGDSDCADGSDEEAAMCRNRECLPGQFRFAICQEMTVNVNFVLCVPTEFTASKTYLLTGFPPISLYILPLYNHVLSIPHMTLIAMIQALLTVPISVHSPPYNHTPSAPQITYLLQS